MPTYHVLRLLTWHTWHSARSKSFMGLQFVEAQRVSWDICCEGVKRTKKNPRSKMTGICPTKNTGKDKASVMYLDSCWALGLLQVTSTHKNSYTWGELSYSTHHEPAWGQYSMLELTWATKNTRPYLPLYDVWQKSGGSWNVIWNVLPT